MAKTVGDEHESAKSTWLCSSSCLPRKDSIDAQYHSSIKTLGTDRCKITLAKIGGKAPLVITADTNELPEDYTQTELRVKLDKKPSARHWCKVKSYLLPIWENGDPPSASNNSDRSGILQEGIWKADAKGDPYREKLMNEYEMKQADRRKRYQALADKAKNEAKGLIDSAYRQIDGIPPGQPILVGHHSERRHRAALERHDKTMRRALDAEQRAKHYAQKANSMDTGISADDPEAVEKLEAKLQTLEKEQALHKLINKAIRLNRKNPEKARNLLRQGIEELEPHSEVERKVNFYLSQEEGIPDFTLRNNNANIRRIKERIEELKARVTQESQSTTINGVEIVEDVEANRLRLIFSQKPEESIRKKLKSHGFRWSPTANAWQRQLTNQARYWGKHIAENLNRDPSQ